MALDLEALRKEMETYLEEAGIPTFHGFYRVLDAMNQLNWNIETHPDFREFITTGQHAGAKLFVYSYQPFSLSQIDEALDLLEDSMLTPDEKRTFETRIRQLRNYEGFTCSLELSFSVQGQTYTYSRETDWYQSLNETMSELEAIATMEEEGEDDGLGGYFSKN
jgi:hypothetical protein